jgi:thymidylate synthase
VKNIPVLHVTGRTLAEGYENALAALHRGGIPFRTQYDKPGDPPSLDATLNLVVEEPMADPMIHMAFPGGVADLREYVLELQGLKDSWTRNINDPSDTRWEYTYHGRLAHHGRWKEMAGEGAARASRFAGPADVDQVAAVIGKLAKQPYTRQAQMITWMPELDLECFDPPCLQSLWYRVLVDDDGVWWLNTNIRFRSNDAWGAHFMNMFGFVLFTREIIADGVAKQAGREVRLGRLNWQADSYHIYGKDLAHANALLFDRLGSTAFGDRVLAFHDAMVQEMYREQDGAILEKIRDMNAQMARQDGGAG